MLQQTFTVQTEKEDGTFGRFIIEPLQQGYGHTLGTSLRRVLLTSLPGWAVTWVTIDGVTHAFSTVSGLKEDVIQLLLNIKKVRFSSSSQQKSLEGKLSVKGVGVITAGDIEISDAEVINTDFYLGELTTSKAKLSMTLHVEFGYGYVTTEEFEGEKALGVIVLDALFSPVVRVNYRVDATRVGRMTNLDKLILDIHTDGTIRPKYALEEASRVLVSYFTRIYEPCDTSDVKTVEKPAISDEILKMTLEEFDLPTRIVNALKHGGIETIEQLLQTPRKTLLKVKNLGGKSIKAIEDSLKSRGVVLSDQQK